MATAPSRIRYLSRAVLARHSEAKVRLNNLTVLHIRRHSDRHDSRAGNLVFHIFRALDHGDKRRLRTGQSVSQAQLSQPALDPVGAFLEKVFGSKRGTAAALQSAADLLVSLSGMLEPDGGMPGKKNKMRVVNS